MADYSYFKDLTPRQQLNDLMHKYAQITGGPYGDSWRELERRYLARHHAKLSILRWQHCQRNKVKLTIPSFIEDAGLMPEALSIGHDMTGHILMESGVDLVGKVPDEILR